VNNGILAIRRGLAYEGDAYFLRAIHPTPIITQARCGFIEPVPGRDYGGIVFREDSFDPVTRIRRGRFYRSAGSHTWDPALVHNYPFGPHIGVGGGSWDFDNHYTVLEGSPNAVNLRTSEVVLGRDDFETLWRVVDTEKLSTGHVMFTLRAVSFLGALPMLADQLTDHSGHDVNRSPVQSALEAVVTTFHRQQPTPIIDVCRETARIVLRSWIGPAAEKDDLAETIKKIPKDRELIRDAASIINRLHPRGKSVEVEKQAIKGKKLRPLVDEDAETSVQLIGLILRDIGWVAT